MFLLNMYISYTLVGMRFKRVFKKEQLGANFLKLST